MSVVIQTISGEVNVRKMSAKVCLFHAPRKNGPGNSEMFLDKAATHAINGEAVGRLGFPSFSPSVPGTREEITGRMVRQSFSIEEGEVVKMFCNIRRGWGKMPYTASIFLRVRAEAAYRRVTVKTLEHPDVAFTHAMVEGCFDLLTLEDTLALGVHIPPAFRSMAEHHNTSTVLTEDKIIQAEASSAPRYEERKLVDESTGNVRTLTVRKKRRAIE